jgi:pimeloyl-ACP methyl ester carboxylesterase
MAFARRTFADNAGRPVLAYDPRLRRQLQGIDFDNPLPTLWPQFDGLRQTPVMVLRGRLSDILSDATLANMRQQRPDLTVVEVADEGHPPLLVETPEITQIADFLATSED